MPKRRLSREALAKIIQERIDAGEQGQEIAERIGVAPPVVSQLKNERRWCSAKTFNSLCGYLGLEVSWSTPKK